MQRRRNNSTLKKSKKGSTLTQKYQVRSDKDTLLDAVALQDHYAKRIKLNDFPKYTKLMKSKLPPLTKLPRRRKLKGERGSAIQDFKKKTSKHVIKNLNYQDVLNGNFERAEFFHYYQHNLKVKRFEKKLSLAQKRGLVQRPQLPLTGDQWEEVVSIAKERLESNSVCPICLEEFKLESQVVLSCSHIFHKDCLRSFERHTNLKQCPVCRRENYEKLQFLEPSKMFINHSAIRIQSLVRKHLARIKFFSLLQENNYSPDSKILRQKLIAFKLERVNKRLREGVNKRKRAYDELFGEKMEKVQLRHAELMADYEKNVQRIMRERNQSLAGILDDMMEQKIIRQMQEQDLDEKVKWKIALRKASERNDTVCAICLQPLYTKDGEKNRPLYLTSCTHIFHATCLSSFEMMSNMIKCPICRSEYSRMAMMKNEGEEGLGGGEGSQEGEGLEDRLERHHGHHHGPHGEHCEHHHGHGHHQHHFHAGLENGPLAAILGKGRKEESSVGGQLMPVIEGGRRRSRYRTKSKRRVPNSKK